MSERVNGTKERPDRSTHMSMVKINEALSQACRPKEMQSCYHKRGIAFPKLLSPLTKT